MEQTVRRPGPVAGAMVTVVSAIKAMFRKVISDVSSMLCSWVISYPIFFWS